MKRGVLAGVFIASVLSIALPALAYTSPGSPTGYVNDFARVLSDGTKQSLEAELTDFEKSTSNEVTVVTVPNMGGDYIENFTVKLFEEWKIGKADTDNGVLLLLSIEERKLRIEVGYGLEGALPDSVAQSILDNELTPRLKVGDYDGAVTTGVRAIMSATKGEYVGMPSSDNGPVSGDVFEAIIIALFVVLQIFIAILARSKSWWAGGLLGLFGAAGLVWYFALGLLAGLPIVLIFVLIGLLFDYIVSTAYMNATVRGVAPPWWAGGSRGGGGGGFGGFGGGSSGGGGASGSW